mgnify:CR=1 FL=1
MNNIYYISQGNSPKVHLENIKNVVESGVKLVQLRMKNIDQEKNIVTEGGQFSNDGTLRCGFECQRSDDSLKGIPLFNESLLINLSAWFDNIFIWIIFDGVETY